MLTFILYKIVMSFLGFESFLFIFVVKFTIMKKCMNLWLAVLIGMLTSCSGKTTTETKMHVIFDNPSPRAMPLALFGEVPDSLATALNIQDGVPSSVSVMLVEKESQQLLFDAGNGNDDSQLLPYLQGQGLSAMDIDAIFITHLHGDHIGGLTKDGQKVFPQAKLYIPSVELEAWTQQPEGAPQNVKILIEAYGENLVKFGAEDKLPCGIEAIPAYGHTPGHTVYRVDDMLIVGDIMHGVALQMAHPEFCARFDMDHEQSIASRKSILEQVASKGWKMYGMHFPTTEAVVIP